MLPKANRCLTSNCYRKPTGRLTNKCYPRMGGMDVSKPKPNQAYLDQLRKRYSQASKKERTVILDEFVATSGYHRKHAIALLRGHRGWHTRATPIRRPRRCLYGNEERRAVLGLAEVFDQISSRRLRAALDAELPSLRRQGYLHVSVDCYQRL